MYFSFLGKSTSFNVGFRPFLLFTVILFKLSITPISAQKKLEQLLLLKGQERCDSLEYRYTVAWEDIDSVVAFKEIYLIKNFAEKQRDNFLLIFSDYLKVRYLLQGKQRNRKGLDVKILKLEDKLAKEPQSVEKEHLIADLKHAYATLLYRSHTKSDKILAYYLAADLFYRQYGYENIIFPDYKLVHLGLYYYDEVADYATALTYFKEAEKYIDKEPVDKFRIAFYKSYANCLVELKQFEKAIYFNKLAIAQVRLKRDSLKIGTISGNIGEIILSTSPNPISAEPYFQKELIYRLKYKPHGTDDIAKVYGNLCQVAGLKHDSVGMIENFNKAIATLNDYVRVSKDTVDIHNILKSIYKNRMIADTLLGDYRSAYRYEKLYYEELMASHQQELRVISSEATVKFDADRNKLMAELANQQVKNTRFWVVVISLLLLLVIIGSYLIYYRQQVNKTELTRKLSFEQKEAERLSTLNEIKTRFFTNISHEFRTPLTLLVGPIDDLQKKYPQEGIIALMQRNLWRLQSLINQLLDLSKLEAGEMSTTIQEVDLSLFLSQIFSSFESLAQSKNIIFNYSRNQLQQFAEFDTDKLEKIVVNLLSNAFKFTPNNGRIIARVDFNQSDQDGHMKIVVQDFGIGIPSERLPHIFDRFYQVDDSNQRQHEGTGIGLSLVKELVNLLNGEIEVNSKVNEGTTFTISLPFVPLKSMNNSFAQFVEKQYWIPNNGELKEVLTTPDEHQSIMLIVDDNPDLRSYIGSIFEKDYQLLMAVDGEEGLQKTLDFIPDVVICDLMMPKLDGLGFCERLKNDERINHIPVVMLTAKASMSDKLIGLGKGADDYLSKPFNKEELSLRVSNLVSQRQLMREKYTESIVEKVQKVEVVNEPTIDELFIQKAQSVIDKYLNQSSFDVDTFADSMNLSGVQLRRKLKAITNHTVTEFVRNYRLEIAADKLKKKTGTVSEIAYEVGFDSLPYFSKVFLEKYGKTPSEWR